jgi:hypothetical protein
MKTSLAGPGRPVIHRAAAGAVGRAVAWCGGWEAKVWKGWRDADAASNMLRSVCGGIGYRFGPRMRATLHGWLVRKRTYINPSKSPWRVGPPSSIVFSKSQPFMGRHENPSPAGPRCRQVPPGHQKRGLGARTPWRDNPHARTAVRGPISSKSWFHGVARGRREGELDDLSSKRCYAPR